MNRGLVHLYYGEGKGKTTAALGLGLRACGRGLRVLLVRFLKDQHSGELDVISSLPRFTALETPDHLPFTPYMTPVQRQAYQTYATQMLKHALKAAMHGECDLLILDEACAAATEGMIDPQQVTKLLSERPASLEVVLTGRNPPQEWLELADYVTEMRCVKHPYEQGIAARVGIEY